LSNQSSWQFLTEQRSDSFPAGFSDSVFAENDCGVWFSNRLRTICHHHGARNYYLNGTTIARFCGYQGSAGHSWATSEERNSFAITIARRAEFQSAYGAPDLNFTDYTLTGQSSQWAGIRSQIRRHKSGRESVRDSLRYSRRKVDLLTDALSDFLEPYSRISAVNHAPQKARPLGRIVAVSPNVVLGDLGVQGKKTVHPLGFGEDISCMAKLADSPLPSVTDFFHQPHFDWSQAPVRWKPTSVATRRAQVSRQLFFTNYTLSSRSTM
jgi:hypothetical protein